MSTYLQSTSEENLYICASNGLWGSVNNKLSQWRPGDLLIAYVDRALAAVFTIMSEPFHDETTVWPSGIYPYRILIELERIVSPDKRYSISSADTRETLFKHHSSSYGITVVLAARPLHEEAAQLLLDHLERSEAWPGFDAEKALAVLRDHQAMKQEKADTEVIEARTEEAEGIIPFSIHTQMQYYLAQLGQTLKYQVWIPKSDQNHKYQNTPLKHLSLPELPLLPFNEKVIQIISNIDVIWLEDEHPTHLFEVEHTTSIYSGLLRMSDLTTIIPSLDIQMFICASTDRSEKVKAEVRRPTFSRKPRPLSQRCRFISFEKLGEFMGEQKSKYMKHYNVSILDEISESLM